MDTAKCLPGATKELHCLEPGDQGGVGVSGVGWEGRGSDHEEPCRP